MYTNTLRFTPDSYYQKTLSWRTGPSWFEPYFSKTQNRWIHPPAWTQPDDLPREVVGTTPTRRKGEGWVPFQRRVNQWYQTVGANLHSQPKYHGHALTSEGGHSFHTVKITVVPGLYEYWFDGKLRRSGYGAPYARILPDERNFLSQDSTKNLATVCGLALHSDSSAHKAALTSATLGAYNSMIPDKQIAGIGETLYEFARGNFPRAIPDLLRRVKRGRELDPKGLGRDLGSDYLNARFGIEPIIKDAMSIISSLTGTHEMLYNTTKTGRKSEPFTSFGVDDRVRVHFGNGENAEFQRLPKFSTYLTSDVSLRAKFSKAVPRSAAQSGYMKAQETLNRYGINEKLTWDIIPWSWLIDWSGSIGKSIENASAFNPSNGRFVTNYGWSTRLTTFTAQAPSFTMVSRDRRTEERITPSFISVVAKQRSQISPLGINFSMSSLSAYQWSILSALGLSKLR